MTLRKITIRFLDIDSLFKEINQDLDSERISRSDLDVIEFDSQKTYRSFMTTNKIEILSVISKLQPRSIYQLAKYIDRQPQHVATDCRSLESHGFIRLIEVKTSPRGEVCPKLIFDFDVVTIEDEKINSIPISEKSNRILKDAIA